MIKNLYFSFSEKEISRVCHTIKKSGQFLELKPESFIQYSLICLITIYSFCYNLSIPINVISQSVV